MASENNLSAVFTDIANSIRSKKGTTGAIQPINMASEIDGIQTGGDEKSVIYQGLEAMGTYWAEAFYGRGYSGSNLFSNITELRESDIPPSAHVTNTKNMFSYCEKLTTIPSFDTSSVTDMSSMFKSCMSLTTIPLLDTSKVTNMSDMFDLCQKLTVIPQLDTGNVINMSEMFIDCHALTTIPPLNT